MWVLRAVTGHPPTRTHACILVHAIHSTHTCVPAPQRVPTDAAPSTCRCVLWMWLCVSVCVSVFMGAVKSTPHAEDKNRHDNRCVGGVEERRSKWKKTWQPRPLPYTRSLFAVHFSESSPLVIVLPRQTVFDDHA